MTQLIHTYYHNDSSTFLIWRHTPIVFVDLILSLESNRINVTPIVKEEMNKFTLGRHVSILPNCLKTTKHYWIESQRIVCSALNDHSGLHCYHENERLNTLEYFIVQAFTSNYVIMSSYFHTTHTKNDLELQEFILNKRIGRHKQLQLLLNVKQHS